MTPRDDTGAPIEPGFDQTGPELRRLAALVATLMLLGVLPYVLPQLQRVRPWVPGEGLPIARMFGQAGPEILPSFAEAGLVTSSGQQSEEELAEELGAAVAGNLGEVEEEPPAATGPAPADGGIPTEAAPLVRIEPKEYEGITQPLENARVLAPFFEALRRSAARQPGAITRIAHYGDSAVAADAIAHTARRRMQRRFGDAGHGFILISRGDMHYMHKDIVHRSSDGWETFSAVRDPLGRGWYGYGGVQLRGKGGEYAHFGTVDEGPVGKKVSRFEIFYQRYRSGGRILVSIDGERREPIDTRKKPREDGWSTYEVPDGPHKLRLRVSGGAHTRLYGVALERDVPGVVYDSLGLVGARAERLLNSEPDHVKRQIAHRDPDLLVLGFGGNEAANAWLNLKAYEKDLVRVVRHMRAGKPEMPCLLFGPLDQGKKNERGRVVTIEKIPGIVEVQRRVAKQLGCAFYDTYGAMGGEGAVAKWRKARPRLMTSDLRHATPEGYEVIGNLYYKAILKAFAEYLAAR
ncbi:MAG: GDSL-type esterase/lipase family protein [Myxococcales bacterium]